MHKISRLKNGATLITVPVKGTRAQTVLAMFPVGSRYESPALSGASHFIEHMMFKGTQRRPNTQLISRELDAVGAEYNAFTSKDHTGYYVKINSAESERAFDILSDMLFHSVIDSDEVTREKGVIVEELRMYEDNPTMSVDSLFDAIAFAGNTLAVDIGGTVESVRALDREQMVEYYHGAYRPENMVLVVAGDIDQAKLKKNLKYFETVGPNTGQKFNFKKFSRFDWRAGLSVGERVSVKQRQLDQTHLILGFPGMRNNHPDRYALSVLLNILGGTMSSRLFEEVRNKRGLCYMIHASGGGFRDTGTVQIQAGLDPSRLEEAISVVRSELEKISTVPVSARELSEAKSNFSGRMVLGMEESNALANWFAKQFWFSDKMETFEQALAKIKKVSARDVQRVAKKLFVWSEARLAIIGAVERDRAEKLLR